MDILDNGLIVKVLGVDSTEYSSMGNASRRKKRKKRNKKAKIKDAVQSMGQRVEEKVSSGDIEGKGRVGQTAEIKVDVPNMDTELTKNLLDVAGEGKKKKKKRKRKSLCKMEITNDVQSMDTNEMAMDLSETLTLETMTVKMAKRKKKRKRRTEIKDGAESKNQNEMYKASIENLNGLAIGKRKAENESIILGNIEEVQSMEKHKMVTALKENVAEAEIINRSEMDKASTEIFSQGIAAGKSNSRRKRERARKRKNIRVEVQIKDQPTIEIFTKGNETGNGIGESSTDATQKDEVKGIDQNKMATGSVENLAGENVTSSRKRKKKRKKAGTGASRPDTTQKDEVKGIDQNKMATGSVENLAEENVTSSRKRKKKHKKPGTYEAQSMSEQESVPNFHLSDEARFGPLTQPLEILETQSKCIPGENNQYICDPTYLGGQNGEFKTGSITVSNKFILDEVNSSSEGRGVFSTCNVNEADDLFVKTVPITSVRRKLLVLDVNGLLADVVNPPPKHCRGDIHISHRAIFRRPFCDDFLKFCFQNFDVGIWSSRSRAMIRIVKFLLGDLHEKLLFCWDMSRCTQTGFKTLENHHKPLVCKELRKIWENDDPNLPWKKGDFDKSNTLLVDDSPYKALLNPLHTAIFPSPYHYVDTNDTSLGPEGDIRVYLEKLAKSENIQNHVEQHPFGQKAIDEQSSSWGFYSKVLDRMSDKFRK